MKIRGCDEGREGRERCFEWVRHLVMSVARSERGVGRTGDNALSRGRHTGGASIARLVE